MKKKIFAVIALAMMLILNLTAVAFADDFQDPYKAYGVKPGGQYNAVVTKISDNPPKAIKVKLHSIIYLGAKIPISSEEIVLERDKFTNINISVDKINSVSHVSNYNPIPNRYANITSIVSLKLTKEYDICVGTHKTTYVENFYNSATDKYELSDTQNGSFEGKTAAHLGFVDGKPAIYFSLPKAEENRGAEIAAEIVGVQAGGVVINNEVDTDASKTSGETSLPVPAAVVISLVTSALAAGAGAAAASAGAASGADDAGEEEEESDESTYKMCIYKEFGDKIKYDGEAVFVYAKMVEVTNKGVEIQRVDLTQQIEIFSDDSFLSIGTAVLSGDYMGASVSAVSDNRKSMPDTGTISFKFSGDGGTFQNNVRFKMAGECFIELGGQNLFVLSGSGDSFEMPYRLVDFVSEAKVRIEAMQKTCPVEVSLEEDKKENKVIVAKDSGEKKPFERFFESYSCEIIAENDKEYARAVFDVVVCHEGLLPDFLGKSHEIRGYKNDEGDMEKTNVAFKLGVWNNNDRTLDFVMPEEIEINCTDEGGIFEIIGLEYEIDEDSIRDDAVIYNFTAKISLPALEPIKGKLTASCSYGEANYENETDIKLIPDIQEYYDNLEQEYEKCKYIINTYMSESWRDKKLEQLEKAGAGFGVKDYQLFRKNCWQFAQNLIMQEKESYLKQSYSADIAIAYLEIYVYIGDVAFDIALMPVGGPIAGFLISQAKSMTLELIAMGIEKGNIGFDELMEIVVKRVEQASGQADGAVAMPKPNEPGKLAVWLSCFFIYRFLWHWKWGEDENKNPIGVTGALERAVFDFSGKAVAGLLGGFVEKIAEKSSFANTVKKVYNKEADEKLAKPVTDMGDNAFNSIIETLKSYLEKIKIG